MSGLALCWHLDGRPVEDELERMVDAAAGRGRNGRAMWRDGSIALAQLHLATSPADGPRPKLAIDNQAALVVAVHGHVHERVSLQSALGAEAERPVGDAELILLAYRRWGTELMRHVLGDLAVVVWDGRERRIVAISDHLGFRPLVWWADRRHVLVASEAAQLVAHGAPRVAVNEPFLGEAYANRFNTPGESLLTGVRRLGAGCVLIVDAGGRVVERRWGDSPLFRPAHRRTDDWVSEYRSTFQDVVHTALDTAAPQTVMVSGGLDSSSILCTAAEGGWLHPDADLLTYDVRHEGADDPAYSEAVAARIGRVVRRLPLSDYNWERSLDFVRDRFTLPIRSNAALHRIIIDRTAAAGRNVVVTGEGGDEWLNHMLRFWPDRLLLGQLSAVGRAAFRRSGGQGLRRGYRTGRLLLSQGVVPLLQRHPPYPPPPMATVPAWIAPAFAKRVELAARLRARHDLEPRGPVFPARYAQNLGGVEIESTAVGVEYRHPFHDRRLVDLMFAMPEELSVRNGEGKWVLRQAMRDTLPPAVGRRTDKGHFRPFMERDTLAVLDCLGGLDHLLGVELGFVDRQGIGLLVDRTLACIGENRMPNSPIENVANVWAVLSADIWLAVRLGREPPVPPTPTNEVPECRS